MGSSGFVSRFPARGDRSDCTFLFAFFGASTSSSSSVSSVDIDEGRRFGRFESSRSESSSQPGIAASDLRRDVLLRLLLSNATESWRLGVRSSLESSEPKTFDIKAEQVVVGLSSQSMPSPRIACALLA